VNKTEHLLTCLIEECAEVQKAAAKALRFGLEDHASDSDVSNAEDIAVEICDLIAVVEMLEKEKIIPNIRFKNETLIPEKKNKVIRYMDYARERKTLEDTDE
jgi:NTP pyrophosphatase (non-canonical NTP hydrolase)